MKGSRVTRIGGLLLAVASIISVRAGSEADPGLPFVYTEWEHLTVADGLPNDHIFAVKAAEPYVWIGTEDGLARFDKRDGKIQVWRMEDGLPWKVITGIDVSPKTGDVWLGLFGGGLARLSGGKFEHWHQLNSGLVNDVVYGVATLDDEVWVATTAGTSRFNPNTGQWTIYNEKNAPFEEIWNYGVHTAPGMVYLAVWGSGVLEYDLARDQWKEYLDPDGEMEIDLYRDDGIIHVITTGVNVVDGIYWISTYFGACRYDGRNWRGYYAHETGLGSDFNNNVRGRSANEAWFLGDKGAGAIVDFPTDTWVTYTRDDASGRGQAVVKRGAEVIQVVPLSRSIPHNFTICADFDGPDVWVGTSKGLGRGIGKNYYARLRPSDDSNQAAAGTADKLFVPEKGVN